MKSQECPHTARRVVIVSDHHMFIDDLEGMPICVDLYSYDGRTVEELEKAAAGSPSTIIVCEDACIDAPGGVLDARDICRYFRKKLNVPIVLITHGDKGSFRDVGSFADVEVRKPGTRKAMVEFASELLRLTERVPPHEAIVYQRTWSLAWTLVAGIIIGLLSGGITLLSTKNLEAAARMTAALLAFSTFVLKLPEVIRRWWITPQRRYEPR